MYIELSKELNTKHRTWNLSYTMEITIEITQNVHHFTLSTCAHARAHLLVIKKHTQDLWFTRMSNCDFPMGARPMTAQ